MKFSRFANRVLPLTLGCYLGVLVWAAWAGEAPFIKPYLAINGRETKPRGVNLRSGTGFACRPLRGRITQVAFRGCVGEGLSPRQYGEIAEKFRGSPARVSVINQSQPVVASIGGFR